MIESIEEYERREEKFLRKLSTEALYNINGGDKSDYDFGYKVGKAARWVYDKVTGVWHKVFG